MKTFTMSKYKKFLLGGALTLAMGAMPLAAHATPYAFASNMITGLAVTQASSGSPYPSSSYSGQEQINASSQYAGAAGTPFDLTGSIDAGLSNASPTSSGQSFVGTGTPPSGYTPSGVGSFTGTRANAAILGGTASASGVGVNNVAEGYGNSLGTSTAGNAATIKLNVTGTGQALKVAFTDAINLIASTSAGSTGQNANSSVSDAFQISNAGGTILGSFTPFGGASGGTSTGTAFTTSTVASESGSPARSSYASTGSFSYTTGFNLISGDTYTLSLTSGSIENITPGTGPGPTPVPEPGSLLLLGTGLLGLGLVSRKRIKKI
jgi:hypothetical protein